MCYPSRRIYIFIRYKVCYLSRGRRNNLYFIRSKVCYPSAKERNLYFLREVKGCAVFISLIVKCVIRVEKNATYIFLSFKVFYPSESERNLHVYFPRCKVCHLS